ncbi:MAG: multidrug DMT transporter permease [Fidelibacterota bacterium]|nr:MAG: multidrug DMT transporter permease [Candidatus Neomarinimicrobiota bacterium]
MVVVESYLVAVIMCLVTMLCWGSWANTQKLATKQWPFQLFYWDYAIGVLVLSFILALTMGSFGSAGRSFFADLGQASLNFLWLAFLGGVIFNLANILLVAAIDIAGMAVAFPIGIGLALALGVITNYIATPLGNPVVLFLGVALVVGAILLDAIAYRRLPSEGQKTTTKGILISVAAGVLMGFFYRFVAASMSEDYIVLEAGKLSPYSAVFVFSIGLLASNFVWNTFVMAKPFAGDPVSYRDYFTRGDARLHSIGILGGIIWGIGMSLSIIAAGAAGFAISYGLGQGATMVAALWGVFIWKEFKDAPKGTNTLIALMFACFIIGLGLIITARLT